MGIVIKICALLQIFLPILENRELLAQSLATKSIRIYYSEQNRADKWLCVNVGQGKDRVEENNCPYYIIKDMSMTTVSTCCSVTVHYFVFARVCYCMDHQEQARHF